MIDEARGSSRSGSTPRSRSYSRPPVRQQGRSSSRSTPAERVCPRPSGQDGAGYYATVHHQHHRALLDARNHASPRLCQRSTCECIATGLGRCPLLDDCRRASVFGQVQALPSAGWSRDRRSRNVPARTGAGQAAWYGQPKLVEDCRGDPTGPCLSLDCLAGRNRSSGGLRDQLAD